MFTLTTVGIVFVALLLLPVLKIIGVPEKLLALVRMVGFPVLAYFALTTGVLPLWAALLIAVTQPLQFFLMRGYFLWVGWKALNGDYGDGKMWVAELVQEKDEEFIQAMNQLTQMDVEEIMVIAESKQELKELTIERANE